MNSIRYLRRLAAALAGLACAWLGIAVAAPAAFAAVRVPPPVAGSPGITVLHNPPGWNKHPPVPPVHQPVHVPVQTVVVGGMPGWQIALIATGAALLAAALAITVDRLRPARGRFTTTAA